MNRYYLVIRTWYIVMLLYSSRGTSCSARLNSRRGYNQQIFLLHLCGHLVESCYIEYGSSPESRDSSTILWILRHGYYFRLHKSRLCGSCIITFSAVLATQDVWIIIFIKMCEIVGLDLNTLPWSATSGHSATCTGLTLCVLPTLVYNTQMLHRFKHHFSARLDQEIDHIPFEYHSKHGSKLRSDRVQRLHSLASV